MLGIRRERSKDKAQVNVRFLSHSSFLGKKEQRGSDQSSPEELERPLPAQGFSLHQRGPAARGAATVGLGRAGSQAGTSGWPGCSSRNVGPGQRQNSDSTECTEGSQFQEGFTNSWAPCSLVCLPLILRMFAC